MKKSIHIRCISIVTCLIVCVFTMMGSSSDNSNFKSHTISAEEMHLISDNIPENINWNLILVNPWNTIPDDYQITLIQLKNNEAIDERCYPDLQKMMDDCRAEGLSPFICSSYRSQEKQETLYNNKVNEFIKQGYSLENAEIKAGTIVAIPGTSEHQLGLAVDIVDTSNYKLDNSQEETDVQQWLMQNSWKYGFILRYPNNKTDITGIIYEPWHYRYVGKDIAKELYKQKICLEEYLETLYGGKYYV